MPHELNNTIALLENTPAAVNALLRHLPEFWTTRSEGENTWNAWDVVGHLIYAEHADWIPRMALILESGEAKAFEPFDRQGHRKLYAGRSLEQLLDEFAVVRAANLTRLRALNLTDEQLERKGLHPALGSVTLNEMLATWAAHDLTHLHQIARVMSYQYRDAVGPFRAFLGVMQCAGHSAP
jgi:hypothetical protein